MRFIRLVVKTVFVRRFELDADALTPGSEGRSAVRRVKDLFAPARLSPDFSGPTNELEKAGRSHAGVLPSAPPSQWESHLWGNPGLGDSALTLTNGGLCRAALGKHLNSLGPSSTISKMGGGAVTTL